MVEEHRRLKYVTTDNLIDLGYAFTGRTYPIGDTKIVIVELKNIDNKNPVSFCYLFNLKLGKGTILPAYFLQLKNYLFS